jgi:broad specificity phosphatase PhoE
VYPEVESLQTVYERAREFLVQDRANGNYLVATHKGVKKALLMGLLKEEGIEVDYRSFELQNCSVFVIEVPRGGSPRLVAVNGLAG